MTLPPSTLRVWAVMYEDWEGRIRPGGRGSCETNIAMTKATVVETDTVRLNQRNWQGAGGRAGKIEDKIAGVGSREHDSLKEREGFLSRMFPLRFLIASRGR